MNQKPTNYREQLQRAIEELQQLRDESVPLDERKLRLSELKEHFRLMGLYEQAKREESDVGTTDGADESAELEEIRNHLEPLGLAPADTPLTELARLAALAIAQK